MRTTLSLTPSVSLGENVLTWVFDNAPSSSSSDESERTVPPRTGSFFNSVPSSPPIPISDDDDDDDEAAMDASRIGIAREDGDVEEEGSTTTPTTPTNTGETDEADAFDRSIEDLMKRRRAKPLASRRSTVGGVPTSMAASGFGNVPANEEKKSTTKGKNPDGEKKNFVEIGPTTTTSNIDSGSTARRRQVLNDVNNPEYDDQGYTLYADEKTGERSRVFEALIEYPTTFTMKIVGSNESGTFVKEMVQIVADTCGVNFKEVDHSDRVRGRWVSVTVNAPVRDAEMLYGLYEAIDRDPRVKFKF